MKPKAKPKARPKPKPRSRPKPKHTRESAAKSDVGGAAGSAESSTGTSAAPGPISSLESLANVVSAKAEAEGSPPQAPGQYIPVKSACLNCRKSRVKCDKMLPCKRCRRLGQECKPQKRGRGRPPTSMKGPDESHLLVMESRLPRGVPHTSSLVTKASARTGRHATKAMKASVKALKAAKEGLSSGIKRKDSGSSRQSKGAKRKFPESRSMLTAPGKRALVDSSVVKNPSRQAFQVLVDTFNKLLEKQRIKPQSCASYTRYWAFVSAHLEFEELKAMTLHLAGCLGISVQDIYSKRVAKRDPLQAFQLIPQEYRLQSIWNTADVAYVEQTVIDGASSLVCNDLFRKLFFDEHVPQSAYKDLLSRLIFEKDIDEFYQTFGEAIFTSNTGGGGTVVRHVLRFNVRYSTNTMLGLIYHHSFVSPDGSIAHCASRIFPLPSSKLLAKIKQTVDEPNIIPLETKRPHTQPIPGQGPFDNVHGSAWLQSALAAAVRNAPLQYGLPMGMPMSPQLSPSSPHGLFFPQQRQQGISSSSASASPENLGMGMISSVMQPAAPQSGRQQPPNISGTVGTQEASTGSSRTETVRGSDVKRQGSGPVISAELSESERQKDLKQHKLRTA